MHAMGSRNYNPRFRSCRFHTQNLVITGLTISIVYTNSNDFQGFGTDLVRGILGAESRSMRPNCGLVIIGCEGSTPTLLISSPDHAAFLSNCRSLTTSHSNGHSARLTRTFEKSSTAGAAAPERVEELMPRRRLVRISERVE